MSNKETTTEMTRFKKVLTAYADNQYCLALKKFVMPEALGWEAKVKTGKFAQVEYDAHKAAHEAMGAHRGIYAAIGAAELDRAAQPASPPDERAAFEAFMRTSSNFKSFAQVRFYGGVYDLDSIQDAWEGWQARALLAGAGSSLVDASSDEWVKAQSITDMPVVDSAIRNLIEDSTNDNAVCVVREVMRRVLAAQPASPPDERADFEAWWQNTKAPWLYQERWEAWQARALLAGAGSSPTASPESVEPVLWQWRRKSDLWRLDKTFYSEVFATTEDSEVRALYAGVPTTQPATASTASNPTIGKIPQVDLIATAAPSTQVDDMATLLRMLVHAHRKAAPGNALAEKAMDYLKRHGLTGNILRDSPTVEKAWQKFCEGIGAAAPQTTEICWLVELFLPHGNSLGIYHTGFTDLSGQSLTTADPHKAKRYSKGEAEAVAEKLQSMRGVWRAVEHGFDAPEAEQGTKL